MLCREPRKIVVEEACRTTPLLERLKSNLPSAQVQIVESIPDTRELDVERLEVVKFRGRFIKSCPGTRHYFCCGYQILHFGVQCSLNCTYCILQAYLNQPNLRIFGNTEDLFSELDQELRANRKTLYRIGTGEFTDSLLLDRWTEFSRDLVPFFARQPNAVLELKTKTDTIANLEGLEHGGHTLVAWSLNAPSIRRREEAGAATLEQRLAAARQVSEWGYKLAFHFDPMIEHPGWRQGYEEVLEQLFSFIDAGNVVWISLGGFRFMPELKPMIQSRHPKSRIVYGEFIKGLDGKLRYFRDIRVELYSFMVNRLREIDPGICVYLCMEGEDIWEEVFGFSPEDRGGLPTMLDNAVKARMKVGLECDMSLKPKVA